MLKEFKKLMVLMTMRSNKMIKNDEKLFDIIEKQWEIVRNERKKNYKIYKLVLALHGFDYRKFNYYSNFESMKINGSDILKERNFLLK